MAVEGFVLDGLDLNPSSGTTYTASELRFTPAKKRPEWAENSDGDGSLLIRDPTFENSQWDATIVVDAASRDAAHTAAGAITDKLEEAERQPLGIPLVWTPADSTKSLTFYVLTGELNGGVPIDVESGYFASPPRLTVPLTLTCRSFGYGAEVTVTSAGGAGPLQIFSVAGVTGDVAAEARLIVTDTASQSRDLAVWGLEWRYQAAADLLLTQPDLTATGFAGTSTTRSGSVSTNVYRGTLTPSAVAVCGTGNQPHVGTFRPYLRCYPTSTDIRVRLTYRDGDGPLRSLEWETPVAANAWNALDLGVITIPPKLLGTQRWQGQIEAYSATVGDTLDVDYLILMPAGEGFGRARRPLVFETPQVFSARDEFNQTAGALAGKVMPVGGTWAGAGDADDFSVETTGHTAQRTAVSDTSSGEPVAVGRIALAGVATYTTVAVQVDVKFSAVGQGSRAFVFARYTDANNFVLASITQQGSTYFTFTIQRTVGGSDSIISTGAVTGVPQAANTWYTLRFLVDSSGRAAFWVWPTGGSPGSPLMYDSDAALATGGGIASGRVGFGDHKVSAGAVTRSYDNFAAFVPLDNAVCFSGQSIEFRSDDTIREDSTGTYYGRPQEYRGAPFYVYPSGDEARTNRVAVMLRRNDIYTRPEPNVTDNQSVEVRWTPRYMYLPR